MNVRSLLETGGRKAYYVFQKLTGHGVDADLERDLRAQADAYLARAGPLARSVPVVALETLPLDDRSRYAVFRDDVYVRFVAEEGRDERDRFDRAGSWVPRGSVMYYDAETRIFVKVFDDYYCQKGVGRFLPEALDAGLYDFLCPGLTYLIKDAAGTLRGYAIEEGEPLTPYLFERYVGGSWREVICAETRRTGLYFTDLTFHNVVRLGPTLSLIDLDSVLPVDWFDTDETFARAHLDEVDLGWALAQKWHSPEWYGAFVRALKATRQTAHREGTGTGHNASISSL